MSTKPNNRDTAAEKEEESDLPEGWATASVLDLCQIIRGVSYKSGEERTEEVKGYIPLLRANNIDAEIVLRDLRFVPSSNVSEEQMLQVGDVVIAMSSGSKTVVGKAATIRKSWYGTFGAFCGVLRPNTIINGE